MEEFKTIVTDDGSLTLLHPILKDSYHSLQGAMLEAMHVYIKAGFEGVCLSLGLGLGLKPHRCISVLEMGFGTGLNALLTLNKALQDGVKVNYCTIELYPIDMKVVELLCYARNIALYNSYNTEHELLLHNAFIAMHNAPWGEAVEILPCFTLTKIRADINDVVLHANHYDVVYWDAFSFDTQPHLWSNDIFSKIHKAIKPTAILTTYSAKGEVKRALRESGFTVKRAKGFGTKHHMLIATW